MNIEERNPTRKRIIESLFTLLVKKDYNDITVSRIIDKAELGRRTFYRHFKSKDDVISYLTKLLMNDFANTIVHNHAETQEGIITSYFEFWENHIDLLKLLNKAHLLYFIEDNFPQLIFEVALKTGHINNDIKEARALKEYEKHKYEFSIKLGGIWKATIIWSLESPRKSPIEMSRIINDIIK
ncbi:TetR/AcrR family transcriptional regulator [Anaerocolumna sp. AGMB13020]|uniref:TetR/AcrR family transcriptional regulator n=1 Tax=Anaerocolumna sp. AGMB13020 TaxID=3081750 RepID=UPI0029547E32|nr:TetR/AcrR family transcriptional regulator [Anaerocolumna sp. AGMB13020]WOO36402.1 TetR/AcrR family transcriptional regulator [Anaerocolumna sp. AGMB13020]